MGKIYYMMGKSSSGKDTIYKDIRKDLPELKTLTLYTTRPMREGEKDAEDGMPVLRFYEYERIREVPYQIDFWLEEDSRFLNCRMRIVNESSEGIPMYWWSNMAVP